MLAFKTTFFKVEETLLVRASTKIALRKLYDFITLFCIHNIQSFQPTLYRKIDCILGIKEWPSMRCGKIVIILHLIKNSTKYFFFVIINSFQGIKRYIFHITKLFIRVAISLLFLYGGIREAIQGIL